MFKKIFDMVLSDKILAMLLFQYRYNFFKKKKMNFEIEYNE